MLIKKINKEKIIDYLFYFIIFLIISYGILARLGLYITSLPFWYDEIEYSLNLIDKNFLDMFLPFEHLQKAPPLFNVINLFFAKFFGFNIHLFRLIPFLAGISSVFLFFLYLKDIFKNKITIILGTLLFSCSQILIYYSNEFKPYSLDILFCIILLFLYKKIDFEHLTLKKLILYSIFSGIIILFSFPTMFIIPSLIFAKFIEDKRINIKALFILTGPIISCSYILFSDFNTFKAMQNYWYVSFGHTPFSINNIYNTIAEFYILYMQDFKLVPNLKYLIVFFIIGTILFFIYQKKERFLLFFILLFACTASILKLYPLSERVALWITPILIIILIKVCDLPNIIIKNNNVIKTTITLVLFISLFYLLTNNKILYINYDAQYLINCRELSSRRENIKELAYYYLTKSKKSDALLIRQDIYDYFKFYSQLYKLPINPSPNILPEFTNIEESKNAINNFIKDNPPPPEKSCLWITCSQRETGQTPFCSSDFIESILNDKKLKYTTYKNKSFYIYSIER